MPTKYEVQFVCDNCGRLVSREQMDGARFAALVSKMDLSGTNDDAADDLVAEEGERPIEVLIRHVPVCRHCQERS